MKLPTTITLEGINYDVIEGKFSVLIRGIGRLHEKKERMFTIKEFADFKTHLKGKKSATDTHTLYWNDKPQCEGVYKFCVSVRQKQMKNNLQLKETDFKII